jgi:hypothetical protein
MSGDTSSDDSQGEECLENGWCSTAGGKERRVEVINGTALPKCRVQKGGGCVGRGMGSAGCVNVARACARGELGRGNNSDKLCPGGACAAMSVAVQRCIL